MTESIIRSGEDSWAVYIDGLFVGSIFSEIEDEWPIGYHYTFGNYISETLPTIADCESGLVADYKVYRYGSTLLLP